MATATWRNYLRTKTRQPLFLWRMVIAILLGGVVMGLAVDAVVPAWINPERAAFQDKDETPPEPEPTPVSEAWDRLERLADAGDWGALWRAIPGCIAMTWTEWGVTTLAVLTGLCWLAFVIQSIQIRGIGDYRLWGPIAGLALGVVSIWPTVFLIFWQERAWGLADSQELVAGVRYYALGVGLREELSKFVCFLPLLPWLVHRRDELAALLVAGSVGLGFAMEENVSYIWSSAGNSTLVRLLTPAPLHMMMTGLVGLAAYRACVWPRQCGLQFIAVFGVIVLAHGAYDCFAVLPALTDISLAGYLIFLSLAFQFFREMRPLQALRTEPISLTANFLFCVSTVAAATVVYVCAAVGWRTAGDVLVGGVVAQGAMVYLFIREMPERMVSV